MKNGRITLLTFNPSPIQGLYPVQPFIKDENIYNKFLPWIMMLQKTSKHTESTFSHMIVPF